jgi:hypothetical protein
MKQQAFGVHQPCLPSLNAGGAGRAPGKSRRLFSGDFETGRSNLKTDRNGLVIVNPAQ